MKVSYYCHNVLDSFDISTAHIVLVLKVLVHLGQSTATV